MTSPSNLATGPETPRALGSRYALERLLGSGAMGQVWVARDRETNEALAAKLLRREFAQDPGIVARFIQERSILVKLVHPNVVKVRDLVVEGSDLAIVMDLVEGQDLRGLLRARGRLAPGEAVRIAVDVLEALAAAHALNILHRDVKPDNVLLDGGDPPFVRLSDFGIARLAQETTVKMTGLVGTAEYMAPEVLTDEVVSAASDVYGVGVMLYELLAGYTPFGGGGNVYAVARRHELALPPSLPGLPGALLGVLSGMLSKDPSGRRSASQTAVELRGLLPSLGGLAALPPTAPPSSWASLDGRTLGSEIGSGAPARPMAAPADELKTFIRGDEIANRNEVLPVPAEVGWQPALGGTSDPAPAEATMLRPGELPSRPKPLDTLDLVAETVVTRSKWRHPAVITGIVTLLVAAAVGGFVVLKGGGGKTAAKKTTSTNTSTQPVTENADQDVFPDDLSISRSATYSPADKTLKTTITYTPGNFDLAGPFFEVVPGQTKGGDCPATTTWTGTTVTQDNVLKSMTGGKCGWDLGFGALASKSKQTATYTIPFDPGSADPNDAVTSYLQDEVQETADELKTGLTNQTDFAAQRITGIEIDVTTPSPTAGKALAVSVYPEWTSGPDTTNPLYSSMGDHVTDAALAVGGAVALTSPDCQSLSTSGGTVVFRQPETCTLTATLGGLQPANSAQLTVALPS